MKDDNEPFDLEDKSKIIQKMVKDESTPNLVDPSTLLKKSRPLPYQKPLKKGEDDKKDASDTSTK